MFYKGQTMNNMTGEIFDIQGFSVYDGPGCRTLIFLKGCTLRCKWCANPESNETFPVPMFDPSKCLLGGECIEVCPHGAIKIINNEKLTIDRKKCYNCKEALCHEVCDTGAIRIAGYHITIDEVLKKVDRDRKYWGRGGGITLTGGEPFLQHEFAYELLKSLHEKIIHTAVETCGNVPWENIRKSLPYLDWIFLDIKHMDPTIHKEKTKCDNSRILENLKSIASEFEGRIVVRMVIIPGINDDDKNVLEFATFIKNLNRPDIAVNLLPLHHLAKEKYHMLEQEYFSKSLEIPDKEEMEHKKDIVSSLGIKCYIGSDTPF